MILYTWWGFCRTQNLKMFKLLPRNFIVFGGFWYQEIQNAKGCILVGVWLSQIVWSLLSFWFCCAIYFIILLLRIWFLRVFTWFSFLIFPYMFAYLFCTDDFLFWLDLGILIAAPVFTKPCKTHDLQKTANKPPHGPPNVKTAPNKLRAPRTNNITRWSI